MRDLRERLEVWTGEGLLGADQAEAIARFEAAAEHHEHSRRVLPAEAIGYVGSALAFSAIAWMLSEIWVDITTVGQLALLGLVTVLLFGGGFALVRTTSAPLQRLTSVLFLGGLAGAVWFVAVLAGDVIRVASDVQAVLMAGTLFVLAVPLYALRRRGLPQAAALAGTVSLAVTLLLLPALDPDVWVFGLTIWAIGVGWLLLSLGGILEPTAVSGVFGGALALIGPRVAGVEGTAAWWLALGVLTAGALVVLALLRDTVHHLAVGAVGLFVLVPMLAFELFGDTIGAPATLLVIGLLLVAIAVGVGRAGREIRRPGGRSSRPVTPRLAGR
jgi:hypothetical protein